MRYWNRKKPNPIGSSLFPYCRIACWSLQPGSWSIPGARPLSWCRSGGAGFGGGWTDGLLLLADHRPPGAGASVPDGRGHGWLQHPPHTHHTRGHLPLLLHQLPLGLQPPPAAPQARVRGQNELPSGRRPGEGTACSRAGAARVSALGHGRRARSCSAERMGIAVLEGRK